MLTKISLGISALLAVAVGYLFFKSNPSAASTTAQMPITVDESGKSSIKPVVIAYFNGDTLMAKYEFFLDKKSQLESNIQRSEKEIEAEAKKKEKEIQELVNYARTSELTEENKAQIEQEIYRLQMEMQELEEAASNKILDKQNSANQEMMKNIEEYAKEYAQQNGIDYVLSYQRAAQIIFYSNSQYDITQPLLEGLNARYRESKKD
jgi:outer membrane protein